MALLYSSMTSVSQADGHYLIHHCTPMSQSVPMYPSEYSTWSVFILKVNKYFMSNTLNTEEMG